MMTVRLFSYHTGYPFIRFHWSFILGNPGPCSRSSGDEWGRWEPVFRCFLHPKGQWQRIGLEMAVWSKVKNWKLVERIDTSCLWRFYSSLRFRLTRFNSSIWVHLYLWAFRSLGTQLQWQVKTWTWLSFAVFLPCFLLPQNLVDSTHYLPISYLKRFVSGEHLPSDTFWPRARPILGTGTQRTGATEIEVKKWMKNLCRKWRFELPECKNMMFSWRCANKRGTSDGEDTRC